MFLLHRMRTKNTKIKNISKAAIPVADRNQGKDGPDRPCTIPDPYLYSQSLIHVVLKYQ